MRSVAIFFVALWGLSAHAAERVALLIGNASYMAVSPLDNPRNDVNALAKVLERNGFAVTRLIDGDYRAMRRTLQDFRDQADGAEIALVYYAGHGIEVAGENFLIPVDARLMDERDAAVEAVRLDDVMRQISGASRLKMVVLDACRNNPFARQMAGTGRGRSVGRGLGRVEPRQANTLIAYAAAAGAITPDGDPGGNSPFTAALVEAFDGPARDVRLMMGAVRDRMRAQLGPQVEPFVYASLGANELVLNPDSAYERAAAQESAAAAARATAEAAARARAEAEAAREAADPTAAAARDWPAVQDATDPAILRSFAELYSGTLYEKLAFARIEELTAPPPPNAPSAAVAKPAPASRRGPSVGDRFSESVTVKGGDRLKIELEVLSRDSARLDVKLQSVELGDFNLSCDVGMNAASDCYKRLGSSRVIWEFLHFYVDTDLPKVSVRARSEFYGSEKTAEISLW